MTYATFQCLTTSIGLPITKVLPLETRYLEIRTPIKKLNTTKNMKTSSTLSLTPVPLQSTSQLSTLTTSLKKFSPT